MVSVKRILIVDDSHGDAILMSRALKAVLADAEIEVAQTGEQALNRLRAQGGFADRPLPDVVLLDCRLPRLTGFEVLDAMGEDASLRAVRIILMSGLVTAAHLEAGRSRGAVGHVQKPDDMEGFHALAAALGAYLSADEAQPFRFPPGLGPSC